MNLLKLKIPPPAVLCCRSNHFDLPYALTASLYSWLETPYCLLTWASPFFICIIFICPPPFVFPVGAFFFELLLLLLFPGLGAGRVTDGLPPLFFFGAVAGFLG